MPRRGRKSKQLSDEEAVVINGLVTNSDLHREILTSSRSPDKEYTPVNNQRLCVNIEKSSANGGQITQSDTATSATANGVCQPLSDVISSLDDTGDDHSLNNGSDSELVNKRLSADVSLVGPLVDIVDDDAVTDDCINEDSGAVIFNSSVDVKCPGPVRSPHSTTSICGFEDSAKQTSLRLPEIEPEDETSSMKDSSDLRNDVAGDGSEEMQSRLQTLTNTCQRQKLEIDRISDENRVLRTNASRADAHFATTSSDMTVLAEETADIYEVQMAALEKTITQLQREVETERDRLADQEGMANVALAQLRRELGGRLDRVTRQLETVSKEKDSAVVKYAQSEATVLSLKKTLDESDLKSKEIAREKDLLLNKVRLLTADKARLSQTLDAKASELSGVHCELEKLREEVSSNRVKIKWTQNRMKIEVDAHKETASKLERTEHKLRETREEAEQVRRDCQAMIRTYQESEEMKSNSLDIQLREKETELKMERQEKSTKEEVQLMMTQELESLRNKMKVSVDENNCLTMKLQTLERERLEYEGNLGRMKEQSNAGLQTIADLQTRLAEMDNLMMQINREKDKVFAGQTEIERLRQANAELQIDMEACRRKEGELLEFTERLTSKNVALQSEFSSLETKCQALERELPILRKQCDEFDQRSTHLMSELMDEQEQNKNETQLLARKLAEKTKAVEVLNLKLEEQANDNKVLRRRIVTTIRESAREIQTLRRRLEVYEAKSRGNLDNQSLGSRASSNTSLDTLGQREQPCNGPLPQKTKSSGSSLEGHDNAEDRPPMQPTQEMLIERIVKLQRAHARKNEKIEFLEEHVSQLVNEVKKKSRLIQNYVMREDAGVLSTVPMDQHKMDVARRGGIMASLYTTQLTDNGLTLDLSLEISRKLQAVLEDTLLKNITLKENIKTLGDEIARLSMERRPL